MSGIKYHKNDPLDYKNYWDEKKVKVKGKSEREI